ncbi:hypothetical protein Vadar_030938 [Vaccinium darrowii]|uniref:Uncharacterized protein n=1 Tax=Vaccinium darrowii TaxID=229202 RepID=A0ACB7X5E2_9ERIC|nr:hypothetical protein Vadar_030938 [Vaccinium darrowii]
MWDPYPLSGHEVGPATPWTVAEGEEEGEQEEKEEWSKSLVRKKVAATRARAPICRVVKTENDMYTTNFDNKKPTSGKSSKSSFCWGSLNQVKKLMKSYDNGGVQRWRTTAVVRWWCSPEKEQLHTAAVIAGGGGIVALATVC